MPVELEMPGVQFNRVVNVKAGFVGGADIAHKSLPLVLSWSRYRLWWRVPKWRDLCFVFYVNFVHGCSLLMDWVLGGPKILAREPPPI
jgi:hypothetical protein